MNNPHKRGRLTEQELKDATAQESDQFQKFYLWMEEHMPPRFFEELTHEEVMLIAHNLTGFHLSEYYTRLHLKNRAIVLTLNDPSADLKILKPFSFYGIKNYQTYVSDVPPPFEGVEKKIRVGVLYFTEIKDTDDFEERIKESEKKEIFELVKPQNPHLTYEEFEELIQGMNIRFLRSLTKERLKIALEMFFRAKTRDHCQYEIHYNKDWKTSPKKPPSVQIVFAWKNTPKYRFLYRLAKMIYRHGLSMKKVNATYVHPYSKNPILMLSLGLDGIHGKAAWEEADMTDFLRELVTLKYFDDHDRIEEVFVSPGLITGNQGNLLRCMMNFIHQTLVHADQNLYSFDKIEEAFCRHPEITCEIFQIFRYRFHPDEVDEEKYQKAKAHFINVVKNLDTGQEKNDIRRKNVFKQSINMIDYCLKTNFYRNNKSAFSFRMDPEYLNQVPYNREEKFPEIPYGIFFIQGMHFFGFHIRFKDLSRGGLRTVMPIREEQLAQERDNIFAECYNLAYTQQKKNKDIPEGGSKAVILLEPFDRLHFESDIYQKELQNDGVSDAETHTLVEKFKQEQRLEYLYYSQRSWIHSLMTLINYTEENVLKSKNVVDYYQKPEYIYLGPDENMHNEMIEWIAEYSESCHYALKKAFISSKPSCGVNHKEYGVTSLGVNVCMQEVLHYLDIDPKTQSFTVKMTGGPDGDVAGNQILNLYHCYPKTAKLLALIDGSGTIYDPKGLDLEILSDLFHKTLPIAHYPPKKLNEGGFLLDTSKKKEESLYSQKTLCYRKQDSKVVEDWLSGSDMNHLLRHNVHQTITDIFIPAGGRPRTLNEQNFMEFLDESGNPTSRGIIEGANLYLTPGGRRELEKRGVIIIKDSSANKGGVVCSSLEVLAGLTMPEVDFLKNKEVLTSQFQHIIKQRARNEAQLLLKTHAETGAFCTDISEWISERINAFTYELLDYLTTQELSHNESDPLMQCLINYCPKIIKENYKEAILKNIPDPHQKAIIACYIASNMVYNKGLSWSPSIVDILPLVANDINIIDPAIDDDLSFDLD